jgi:ElaA protein
VNSGTWTWKAFDDLSGAEVYDILALRAAIFVVEQDCAYQDPDGLDRVAHHCLYREGDRLLAYQRSTPPGTPFAESSLGRIVVHEALRGRQVGRELVRRGIAFNFATWPGHAILIGAQAHLTAFYASLGFESLEDPYLEDGIEHVHMRLAWDPAASRDS